MPEASKRSREMNAGGMGNGGGAKEPAVLAEAELCEEEGIPWGKLATLSELGIGSAKSVGLLNRFTLLVTFDCLGKALTRGEKGVGGAQRAEEGREGGPPPPGRKCGGVLSEVEEGCSATISA